MEFCPECGTMLVPNDEEGEVKLLCPECGNEEKMTEEDKYKKGEEKKKGKEKEVAVVEKERKKIEEPDYDLDTDDAFSEMY